MTENKFKPIEEQLTYIKKGVAEIIPEPELVAKLENSRKTGKPLRVYLGVDPTAPDLHLGHTVVLRKLKHFQDLGHTAVFLIGDFSAMIGDPTGVSETRPPLTREQVDANAKTYLDQVYKILDREKTEVRYNSEWLDKLRAPAIIKLCAYPLARMLEREDFRSRLKAAQDAARIESVFQPPEEFTTPIMRESFHLPGTGKAPSLKRPASISIHELLYPLLTALDAVELKSDVELGASEQKFNLLIHRDIQREYGLAGQVALTMPILVGLDGQRKMSKSLGNYVGINEAPDQMFGKLMSFPDNLMWVYWDQLTDRSPQEIGAMLIQVRDGNRHPMDIKMELAELIVRDFHGQEAARKAADNFQRVFRDRQAPVEMDEWKITVQGIVVVYELRTAQGIRTIHGKGHSTIGEKWSRILTTIDVTPSSSEAERLIKQGGLEVNGQLVANPAAKLDFTTPNSYEVRVGKRKFLRIIVA